MWLRLINCYGGQDTPGSSTIRLGEEARRFSGFVSGVPAATPSVGGVDGLRVVILSLQIISPVFS